MIYFNNQTFSTYKRYNSGELIENDTGGYFVTRMQGLATSDYIFETIVHLPPNPKGKNRIIKCFAVKERKSVKYFKNAQKKLHNNININNATVKESSLEKRLLKIEKNMDLLTKKLNQTNKRKI